MARRRRRRISFGTVLMLVLTFGALCLAGATIAYIAGDDLRLQTGQLFERMTETFRQYAGGRPEPVGAAPDASASQATAGPTATPAPTAEPTAQPQRTVTLSVVGSIYAPKNIRQSGYDEESDTYDFTALFGRVKPYISQADLTLGTIETYFAGEEAGYSNYNAPDALLDAIRDSGFDLLSLASEYALEKGEDGLRQTIMQLENRGMIAAGAYADPEQVGSAQMIKINGVQIAVLAYTYGFSDNTMERTRASQREGVAVIRQSDMVRDIGNARKAGADVVIVMPHWGTKNREEVASHTRSLARALAEAGADLILGAHPNVVQPVEKLTVTRSDGAQHDAYVAYSLGSFLTDSREAQNTAGMILQVRFTYDPQERTTRFDEVGYIPTYIQRVQEDGEYAYRILACADESYIAGQNTSVQKAIQTAQDAVVEAAGEDVVNLSGPQT